MNKPFSLIILKWAAAIVGVLFSILIFNPASAFPKHISSKNVQANPATSLTVAQDLLDTPALSALPAPGIPRHSALGEHETFVAKDQQLETFFKAISADLKHPIILSSKARRYSVNGSFDLSAPYALLNKVTTDLGLIWYFDGQAIYIYDALESTTAMISVGPGTMDRLIKFLKTATLYDPRYPIKGSLQGTTFYIAGPPKYVEIVTSTASFLDENRVATNQLAQELEFAIIKVNNVSVIDRDYQIRDQKVRVNGIASAIRQMIGNWDKDSNLQHNATLQMQNSGFDFSSPSNNPAPASAAEVLNPSSKVPSATDSSTPSKNTLPRSKAVVPIESLNDVRVIPYPDTNSLIVRGTAKQIALIQQLVTALDVARRQIELSLWIIDVSKSDLDTLGVRWSASGKLGGLATISLNKDSKSVLSSNEKFQLLADVQALSSQNRGSVVARPAILTQDNTSAVFDASTTFTVNIKSERVAQTASVTFGTMIDVNPRISPDGNKVEMVLNIEDGNNGSKDSSGSSASAGGDSLPVVHRTRISTVARVGRDQSLLIGGETRTLSQDGVDKVPHIGDWPIIGRLFRTNTTSREEIVRLFLIQPRLVMDEDNILPQNALPPNAIIDNAVDALRKQLYKS